MSPPVIPNAKPPWNYHESINQKGEPVVSYFLVGANFSKKTQANLDRTLDHLRDQPKSNWSRPMASPLGDNIYVIRFKDVTGMQLRLFGHFHEPHTAFVLTLTGYEKDDQYVPPDYLQQARTFRNRCNDDFQSRTQPYAQRCRLCQQPSAR